MNRRGAFLIIIAFLILLFSPKSIAYATQVGTTENNNNSGRSRIILEEFQVSDGEIIPGKEFDLVFTLKNTNKTGSVKSVLITYTNNLDSIYTIYGQSDQVYIDEIKAQGEKQVTLTLKSADKISAKHIKFDMHLSYIDWDYSQNANDITLQIPVMQKSQLEIQSVSLPESTTVGNKARVRVTYNNTGSDVLYNITMNIEDEESKELQQISIGTLAASKVSYAEAYINFLNSGTKNMEVYFTYEDVEGNPFTTDRYKTSLEVMEGNEKVVEDTPEIEEVSNGFRFEVWQFILIGGITVMILIVGILIRKYRK